MWREIESGEGETERERERERTKYEKIKKFRVFFCKKFTTVAPCGMPHWLQMCAWHVWDPRETLNVL